MDFRINRDALQKANIPVDVAFYLATLYFGGAYSKETINRATNAGLLMYVVLDDNGLPKDPQITQRGIDVIESIFLDSEIKETVTQDNTTIDRYEALAEKLRNIYPAGRKEGTAYMWRDSVTVIARKLKTLVKKYNFKFTDEQAIAATKRYVQSFNGVYDYMQLLKYFILKKNTETGEENSQLMSYIENEDGADTANDSWMTEIR